jgi:homoserine dehydrogenase
MPVTDAGTVSEAWIAEVARCAGAVLCALDLDTQTLVSAMERLVSSIELYEDMNGGCLTEGKDSNGNVPEHQRSPAHETPEAMLERLLAFLVSCQRHSRAQSISAQFGVDSAAVPAETIRARLDVPPQRRWIAHETLFRRLVARAVELLMAWTDLARCNNTLDTPELHPLKCPIRSRKCIGLVVLIGGITGPALIRLLMPQLGNEFDAVPGDAESPPMHPRAENGIAPVTVFGNDRFRIELVGVSVSPNHFQCVTNAESIASLWRYGTEVKGVSDSDRSKNVESASVWSQLREMAERRLRRRQGSPIRNLNSVPAERERDLDGMVVVDTSNAPHAAALAELLEDFHLKLAVVTGNAVSLAAPETERIADSAAVSKGALASGMDEEERLHEHSTPAAVAVRLPSLLLHHPAVQCDAAMATDIPLLAFLKQLSLIRPDAVCMEAAMSPAIGHILQRMQDGLSFSAAVREARSHGQIETWDCRAELAGIPTAVKAIVCARALGFSDLNVAHDMRVCIEPLYDDSRQSLSGCELTCVEHRLRCSNFVGCRSIFEYIPSTYLPPPGYAEEYPEGDEKLSDLCPFMSSRDFLENPDGISSLDEPYEQLWRDAKANGCVLRYLVHMAGVYDRDRFKHRSVECPDHHDIRFVHVFGDQSGRNDAVPRAWNSSNQHRTRSHASVCVGLAQVDCQRSELGRGSASDFVAVVKWHENNEWHRASFRGDGMLSLEVAHLMLRSILQSAERMICLT